ncbi:phage tail protein [Enterobacter sp. DE0047]|uniref:phage tail protein n=1 Tax=Enterobacter sp. DE0047 TaxID=2584949 RepID=UPI0011A74A5F|nr:phage tail protein [Enterobacter sp. DE0047]
MADDSLNTPVIVQATRIDASVLPRGIFSQSYILYIISQGTDLGNVASKANEAGQGAYDAQVRNDEQDVTLANHEARITANTNAINLIEVRLTTAEGKIVTLRSDVDFLLDEVIDIQADIVTIQGDVTNLKNDYVSKSATASQTLLSPLNVATSYSVNGTKVVGTRQTGWAAASGSALLGAFNASQTYSAGATYSQSEASNVATGLQQARQRIKALEDALRAHGLIN